MEPWMGALMDNLEVLTQSQEGGNWGRARDQRPAAQPHQDPLAELHARPHLPQPLHHPRRGAEPDAEADEGAGHARRPGHQDRVPRQHRADRHALPHRDDLGPDLRGEPLPRLGAFRAHHAGARRALAAGRLRLGYALSRPVSETRRPRPGPNPRCRLATRSRTC